MADTVQRQQRLDRDRVGFHPEEVVEPGQRLVQRLRTGRIATSGQVAQAAEGGRHHVGGHRHHPVGAGQHGPHRGWVIAAQHREILAAQRQQRRHPVLLGARFLDADDVGVHRKLADRLRHHVAAGPARHVVQDHRQPAVVGHRTEMRQQSGLGGAHIGRRHHQRGIGPQRRHPLVEPDGLGGIGLPGTGQHRHPAGGELHRGGQQAVVFVIEQRGSLAGGPGHHHRLRARRQLRAQQPLPGREVDIAGGREGRRQGGDAAGNSQGQRLGQGAGRDARRMGETRVWP